MQLIKDIQNTRDLVKLGLTSRKAKEMLHRLKLLSKGGKNIFEDLKKAYSEVLRLGYLSKDENTEFANNGVFIYQTMHEATGVSIHIIKADLALQKIKPDHVEYVIRYLTPEVETRKIKKAPK